MFKSYKYRIYPTAEQIVLIEKTIGCCRLVYNLALQVKMIAYEDAGIRLSGFDLCRQLTEMKQDYEWLHEVDSQSLKASVRKVDVSFKNFFNGSGYPKFKNKSGKQSFQCPCNKRQIDFEKGLLTIPKIQDIPIRISRHFSGKIKTITISRTETGKYFASILVDNEKKLPIKAKIDEAKTIGIDLGIKDFAILSDGSKIENPKHYRNNLKRLKCLQRRVSRKKKGSKNRKKAVLRLAIQHERITNMRQDFLHKVSTKLVCDNQATTFCMETLRIENMVKNHKLAQAISDVGWGMFGEFMAYKCDWYGKNKIEIGAFEPSSKECHICHVINKTLTLSDREWTCANCGTLHDRDFNAAKNIKEKGLRNSGWGTSGEPVELPTIVGAKKQEYFN